MGFPLSGYTFLFTRCLFKLSTGTQILIRIYSYIIQHFPCKQSNFSQKIGAPQNLAAHLFESSRRDTISARKGDFVRSRTGFHLSPDRFHPDAGWISLGQPAGCPKLRVQKLRLPEVMHIPDLRSKSMIWLPLTLRGTWEPMVKRLLPKTTPVSRKSPTRTLMVDSIPVGMAP